MVHKKVGVIGAGVMGTGVAQNLAQKGIRVVLVDVSEEVLPKARETIYNSLRFAGMMRRDDAPAIDPDHVIGLIEFTTDYARLGDVDFVVENVVEKLAVIRPPVQAVLDRLMDVPVDIEPRFVTAQQLESSKR